VEPKRKKTIKRMARKRQNPNVVRPTVPKIKKIKNRRVRTEHLLLLGSGQRLGPKDSGALDNSNIII